MDYDVNQLICCCKKYGMQGLEIRVSEGNSILGQKKYSDIELIGSRLRDEKIIVLCIASAVCIKDYNSAQIKETIKLIKLAKMLGAKGIRVFLGNFVRRYDVIPERLNHSGIVASIKEICDFDKNFTVMVETHNEYSEGKVLAGLKKDVDRKNLKFIWDIMHPIENGENIETTWKYIGKDIAHLHIKDGKKREKPIWHDFEYCLLGEGQMPIKKILQLLRHNNYDGFLSLEWESLWREELKQYSSDMDFLLTMFKRTLI